MSAICRIVLLLLVMQAHQAIADTQNVTIDLGGMPVSIPAPAGFHEISQLSPKTRKLAEAVTPPDSRLLAVFVSEDDLGRIMKYESPTLGRSMFLQVSPRLEHLNVPDALFSQLVNQVKQEQDAFAKKGKEEIGPLLDDAAGKLSKEYGSPLKLEVGETVPLGVFMEKTNAVGFAVLQKYRVSANGQLDYLTVGGASIMRVKGKILRAYVNSNYESPKDAEWVRSTLSTWVDQILATNMSQERSSQTSTPSFLITRSDWNSVTEEAIKGGKGIIVLGLLVGLIAIIVSALKKLFRKKEP